MTWERILLLFVVLVIQSLLCVGTADFSSYTNVTTFSCGNSGLERIILDKECGELLSPCYPNNYPDEVSNGRKIWDLEAASEDGIPAAGYRFTINFFETDAEGGNLDLSTDVSFDSTTNINELTDRNYTLLGKATTAPGLTLSRSGNANKNLLQGETFDITVQKIFLSFYTSRNQPTEKGFNITYCADFDQCNDMVNPPMCNNSTAVCVRYGFKNYTCECDDGYEGAACNTDIDECTRGSHGCHADAECSNNVGSFTCTCNAGYTGDGRSCTDIDECNGSNDCDDNADCSNIPGSFTCACKNGYTGNGNACADIDECAANTDNCHAQAVCGNEDGGFVCTCNTGYTGNGVTCDDIEECTNGADNCSDIGGVCNNNIGSFTCSCASGYTGDGVACEDIDECTDNTDNCTDSGGVCTNNNGSFTCMCDNGYSGDGVTCEDIDECSNSTLNNCDSEVKASCANTNGSFLCTCNTGYSGDGTNCTDVNECLDSDRCHANATCKNTVGCFACVCDDGYTGNGLSCTELNECNDGTANCDTNASCINTPGTFTCTCNPGYEGNGVSCTDVNECSTNSHNCDTQATCGNTIGSFTCSCNEGFFGNGTSCADINECDNGDNNCDTNADCMNTAPGFNCTCKLGFSGNGTFCEDIDECTQNTDDCHADAVCSNIEGSFTCACNAGYTGNGNSCTDINECTASTHNCADTAVCENTEGSFTCTCLGGYAGNGVTCTDIDECGADLADCADRGSQCMNTVGSFSCACVNGYSGNGMVCTNVNECTDNLDNCDGNATCTDTMGSFACTCNSGYGGDGETCTEINECVTGGNDCDTNARCMNTLGSFECICNAGYSGDGKTCTDIDECGMGTDTCNVTTRREKCMNTVGSFVCTCNTPEYRGTRPNCEGYYCPGIANSPGNITSTLCTIPGIIEWPTLYDGVMTYNISQAISWLVNLTGQTSSNAMRFEFLNLSVERSQDYIVFSDSPSIADVGSQLAIFTGELEEVYNRGTRATNDNPVGYDNNTNTYTLVGRTEVYIHFHSDRQTVLKGFQLDYRPDEDDCPSSNPCSNGGTCKDMAFDYMCESCSGYEGKNCTIDIDECAAEQPPCHPNRADCTNAPGRFSCSCKSEYSGNGLTCKPLILISNLTVVSSSNATSSQLCVNFNFPVQEWTTNPEYVNTYIVIVTNVADGTSFNVTTNPVNSANFLPIKFPVTASTPYIVRVTYGEIGALFPNAVFKVENSSIEVVQESNSIATAAITDFNFTSKDEQKIIFSWTRPTEAGHGTILEYEIGFERNATDCSLFASIGDQVDCGTEKTRKFPGSRTDYALVGLQSYRTYKIRLRAFTSFGASEWSNVIITLIGEVCKPGTDREVAIMDPCTLQQGSLSSSNFPNPYPAFETRHWQINFNGSGAIKIVFDYFNIELDQDYLDIGEGEIPLEPFNVTNGLIVTRTGDLTGGVPDVVYDENDVNNGLLFLRFKADFLNSAPGFQIHYETNASLCEPDNPCLSGGTCTPTLFNFTCACTSLWQGRVCSDPLVNLTTSCTGPTSGSFVLSWLVDDEWSNQATVIEGYKINYQGLASPVFRSIGESTFTAENLSPYQLIEVTIEIVAVNPSTTAVINAVQSCRTGEASSTAPNSLTLVLSTNGVTVSFDRPTSPNGIIAGYVITYNQTDAATFNETADEGTVETTGLSFTITGLRPYRNYSITVFARNGAGSGSPAIGTIQTAQAAPKEPVTNLETSVVNARNVTLSFVPPGTMTGEIFYVITIVPGNGNSPITTTSSSIVVSNLSPATFYNFTVTASTSAGSGPGNFVTVTTLESVPGPVSQLGLNPVSSTSIKVSWQPPLQTNGIITGYNLNWTPSDSSSPIDVGTDTSFTITGLKVYTNYLVTVYARTAVGNGEQETRSMRTLEGAPVGPVRNVAVALQPTEATFTITSPEVVTGVFAYIVQYTAAGSSTTQTRTLSSETVTLTGLAAQTSYEVTVFPVSGGVNGTEGFSFNFTTPSELPGPVASVTISGVTATSVVVNWTPPTTSNGDITGYRVTWSPSMQGADSGVLASGVRSYEVTGLNPFTNYTFIVLARTAQGESESPVTATERTSEAAPTEVQSLTAVANSASSITVTFFPPASRNGVLLNYNIIIRHNQDDCLTYNEEPCDVFTETLSADASTAQVSSPVTGLRAYRLYDIEVTANTSAGSGPVATTRVRTLSTVPQTVQEVSVTIVSLTSINVTWKASTPFAGASTYTVVATGQTTPVSVNATVSDSTRLTESVILEGLPAGESYLVLVSVTTSAGNGPTVNTTRLRVNNVVVGGAVVLSRSQAEVAGVRGFLIANPCMNVRTLFTVLGGGVDEIDIIVKQAAAQRAVPVFWASVIGLDPVSPYIAGRIPCIAGSTSRRKREVTPDGFVIGFDDSCQTSDNRLCNGPLKGGMDYQVAFRARNGAGESNITEYGESFSVPADPVNPGLQPGEIAAIVICSVIVFLLLILLIVFLVRRRNK